MTTIMGCITLDVRFRWWLRLAAFPVCWLWPIVGESRGKRMLLWLVEKAMRIDFRVQPPAA